MPGKYGDIPDRNINQDRQDSTIGFDITRQPKWDIPEKVVIKVAITGGVIKRARNPHQPYLLDEIRDAAINCIEAGATCIHIHPRTSDGEDVQVRDEFLYGLHRIIDPIKARYGNTVLVDGCTLLNNFYDEVALIESGLVEISPVNAFVMGNVSPKKRLQAETMMMQDNGVKPEMSIRSDGDIDRVKAWLIDPGIAGKPFYWLLLPSFALGGTAMPNVYAMAESMIWQIRQIKEIDPESVIMVCMAGRPSIYLTTIAMMMGLHVRIGMEDTYVRWPHRDELIESNLQVLKDTFDLARVLGRTPATANEYRALIGLPTRSNDSGNK